MGKNEKIINDPRFINELNKYNLSPENVTEYEKYIVVRSGIDDICVMFDKNYNTIAIENITEEDTEDIIDTCIYDSYKKPMYESSNIKNIFGNYTLENFINIGSRIICKGSTLAFNGEIYDTSDNNLFTNLLFYIKFIYDEIEDYFIKEYQLKVLGFEMPYVEDYINMILLTLNQTVKEKVVTEHTRPLPNDLLASLGRNSKDNFDKIDQLYDISNLLMYSIGYEVDPENYQEIVKLPDDYKKVNVRNLANNIVKAYGNEPKYYLNEGKYKIISGIVKKIELINK